MDGSATDGKLLAARGARIEFHRKGDGPQILVLHGGKDLRGWHPYHDLLAAHYDVLAPMHPGFGLSERPPEVEAVDDLAYFYLDLIDDQEWAPVHLIGIGLGGWIAAEMSVRSCVALASLSLIGAVGIKVSGPDTPDVVDVSTMPEEDRRTRLLSDPARGDDLLGAPTTMTDEDLGIFLRNEESETLFTWKPFMHNPALKRRLHRIKVPTLVLWGEEDGVVAPSYGRAFADAIPAARFATIAGTAHLPHLEQPETTVAEIHEFISGTGV